MDILAPFLFDFTSAPLLQTSRHYHLLSCLTWTRLATSHRPTPKARLIIPPIYSIPQDLLEDSVPSRPLIDEIAPMSVLRAEYENGAPSFVQQIDYLNAQGYQTIRRTKGAWRLVIYSQMQLSVDLQSGDGDCFYRCEVDISLLSRSTSDVV